MPDGTLLIGDIVATGDTIIHCLNFMLDFYRRNRVKLRNVIFFTIGGARCHEIHGRVEDVKGYWEEIAARAGQINLMPLAVEKLGHPLDISYED